MAETKIQKIWKDPVWSKVISVVIVAVGTIVYNFVISKTQSIDFKSAFVTFWSTQISLWVAVLLFTAYFLITNVIKYFSKRIESFKYDDKTLALDVALFNRIRNEFLPQGDTIYWLRHNNFAGFSFDSEKTEPLYDIEHESKKSDFEFLNPKLEKIKSELLKEIETFTTLISFDTFPTNTGLQTVPPEWEDEQPERFCKVVNEIHANKHRICAKYDELIKTGRRILKV